MLQPVTGCYEICSRILYHKFTNVCKQANIHPGSIGKKIRPAFGNRLRVIRNTACQNVILIRVF